MTKNKAMFEFVTDAILSVLILISFVYLFSAGVKGGEKGIGLVGLFLPTLWLYHLHRQSEYRKEVIGILKELRQMYDKATSGR